MSEPIDKNKEAQTSSKNKNNNKTIVVVAIIVILLAINGIQLYLGYRNKTEIKEKITIIDQKIEDNKQLKSTRDSLLTELKVKYEQISKLGGDTAALGNQIRKLETDKKNLGFSVYNAKKEKRNLEDQISEIKTMLRVKDEELVKLRSITENQFVEITSLKTTVQEKENSISELENKKTELSKQVSIASILRAENFKLSIINRRNKEKVAEEYRAKEIDRIKLIFEIADNKIAKVETKTVYFRLLNTDNELIFNQESGSGSFVAQTGDTLKYTMEQSFLFDNNPNPLTFMYLKGYEYKPGIYKMELYCEGYKIGATQMKVK